MLACAKTTPHLCQDNARCDRASPVPLARATQRPSSARPVRLHVAPGAPRTTARRGRGGVVERPFPLQRIRNFPLRGRGTPGLRQGHNAPCPPCGAQVYRGKVGETGLRSGPYVCTIQSGRIVCMYVSFWHLCAAQLYVCMYNQKLVCIGMSLLLNIFGFNRSVWQRQFSSYSSNYENTFSNRNRSVW